MYLSHPLARRGRAAPDQRFSLFSFQSLPLTVVCVFRLVLPLSTLFFAEPLFATPFVNTARPASLSSCPFSYLGRRSSFQQPRMPLGPRPEQAEYAKISIRLAENSDSYFILTLTLSFPCAQVPRNVSGISADVYWVSMGTLRWVTQTQKIILENDGLLVDTGVYCYKVPEGLNLVEIEIHILFHHNLGHFNRRS
jgi:hypothetical protein